MPIDPEPLRAALVAAFERKDAPTKRDPDLVAKLRTADLRPLIENVALAMHGAESWRWVGPPNFVRERPKGQRGKIDKGYRAAEAVKALESFWTNVLGKRFEVRSGKSDRLTRTYVFCEIVIREIATANKMDPDRALAGLVRVLRGSRLPRPHSRTRRRDPASARTTDGNLR